MPFSNLQIASRVNVKFQHEGLIRTDWLKNVVTIKTYSKFNCVFEKLKTAKKNFYTINFNNSQFNGHRYFHYRREKNWAGWRHLPWCCRSASSCRPSARSASRSSPPPCKETITYRYIRCNELFRRLRNGSVIRILQDRIWNRPWCARDATSFIGRTPVNTTMT